MSGSATGASSGRPNRVLPAENLGWWDKTVAAHPTRRSAPDKPCEQVVPGRAHHKEGGGRGGVPDLSARARLWHAAVDLGAASSDPPAAKAHTPAASVTPPSAAAAEHLRPSLSAGGGAAAQTHSTTSEASAAHESKGSSSGRLATDSVSIRYALFLTLGVSFLTAFILAVLNPPMTQEPAEADPADPDAIPQPSGHRSATRIAAWGAISACCTAWLLLQD
jgi:hypothetical protein